MKFAHPIWLLGAALRARGGRALFVLGWRRCAPRERARFGDPDAIARARDARPGEAARLEGRAPRRRDRARVRRRSRARNTGGARGSSPRPTSTWSSCSTTRRACTRATSRPSRIARAKAEVARLIHELAGARFGAVAFAGEPMGFPLTADGAAIAQFFRQLEPNDMPVGGTAIARALERARELLARDPKSNEHSRVILLVTDGEDLEGDPVARRAGGGPGGDDDPRRADRRAHARAHPGDRPRRQDRRLPQGRAGQAAHDRALRRGRGAARSKSPSGARRQDRPRRARDDRHRRDRARAQAQDDRGARRARRDRLRRRVLVPARRWRSLLAPRRGHSCRETARPPGTGDGAVPPRGAPVDVRALASSLTGCGWNPSQPFERKAPEVERALLALDAGEAGTPRRSSRGTSRPDPAETAASGIRQVATDHPSASLRPRPQPLSDWANATAFASAKRRLRTDAGPTPEEQALAEQRTRKSSARSGRCSRSPRTTRVPIDLRARAHYLAGNLEFLRGQYEEAVRHYDEALKLVPGVAGRRRSGRQGRRVEPRHRAQRIEDEKKKDGAGAPDGLTRRKRRSQQGRFRRQEARWRLGPQGWRQDNPPKDAGDSRPEAGNQDADAPKPAPQEAGPPPSEPPPPQSGNQDERMLDMLEGAPTLQHEDAKNRAAGRRVRGMADKWKWIAALALVTWSLIAPLGAWAQGAPPRLRSSVDADHVEVGQRFTFQLEVTLDASSPEASDPSPRSARRNDRVWTEHLIADANQLRERSHEPELGNHGELGRWWPARRERSRSARPAWPGTVAVSRRARYASR